MIQNTLVKFYKLPSEIKQAVTSPAGLQAIEKLEEQYHVALADTLIRVLVKDISWEELPSVLVAEHGLKPGVATDIVNVLETSILRDVLPYIRQVSVSSQPVVAKTPLSQPSSTPSLQSSQPTPNHTQQLVAARMPKPRQTPPSEMVKFQQKHSGNAAFYVYAEDEDDIARHRDRLQQIAGESPTAELTAFIDQLISTMGLHFTEEVLEKRFRSIVVSRLRDVRTPEETRALLVRPVKVGGMEYAEDLADTIMSSLEERVQYIHNQSSAQGVQHDDFSSLQNPPVPESIAQEALVEGSAEAPVVAPPPVSILPSRVVPSPAPQAIRKPTVVTEARRPVIRDIQHPNKPMNLADELSIITPDEFRTLGRDLNESVAKVLQKIEILSEDSYDKRAQGIASWRRSPVYQLYLSIGRESMVGGKSIEEVIAGLQNSGQAFLTMNEFSAIADLNTQLIT